MTDNCASVRSVHFQTRIYTSVLKRLHRVIGGFLLPFEKRLRVQKSLLLLVAYFLAFYTALRPYKTQLLSFILRHLTTTVCIHENNETYDMLTNWISTRGLDRAARSYLVKVNTDRGEGVYRSTSIKRPLKYVPFSDTFFFWFNGSLLVYKAKRKLTDYMSRNEISITCLGRTGAVLKDLLSDCQREYVARLGNKISIYGHSMAEWRRDKTQETRPVSTVLLKSNEKKLLMDDMKDFLSPKTREWYSERSLPYRRGYLLHGPPGTGKSSFSLAIAGELGMDIYVVSIPTIDDGDMKTLFANLPDRCVVLLEDIDAVSMACSRDSASSEKGGDHHQSDSSLAQAKGSVTLSGLLNVLDGVSSQEHRVLIMTTNHIGRLDEALIRPGRIDMKVHFGLADQEINAQLFDLVFQLRHDNDAEAPGLGTQDLCLQKTKFLRIMPAGRFSPAEILSFLLRHRKSPEMAIEEVAGWVMEMEKNKEQ